MAQSTIQPTFTSGEIAPSLYGRVDGAWYYKGLKTCRNFIVRQFGGVSNRPGLCYIGDVSNHAVKHRAIQFQFSTEQTYVLIFGNLTMRIIKNGGMVVYPVGHASAGQPVQIVTPWLEADLFNIIYSQSADTLTVSHKSYPCQQITRTDHHLWTVADYISTSGPFQDINIDKTIRVTVSGKSGPVVVDCNSDMFTADMVGELFFVEADSESQASTVKRWEVNTIVSAGDQRRAGSNFYEAVLGGTTGTIRPSTLEGTEYDGDPGVMWKYLHSGSGIVKLTGTISRVIFTDSDPVAPDFPDIGDIITNGSATAEVLKYEYIKIIGQTTGTYGRFLLLPINGTLALGSATSGAWSATLSDVDNEPAISSMMAAETQTYIPDTLVPTTLNATQNITAVTVFVSRGGYWAKVTIVAHGYAIGNVVNIVDVEGLLVLNGTFLIANTLSADIFVVKLPTVPAEQIYTSGGVVENTSDGMASYKWAKSAYGIAQGYPACNSYYQQRKIFGGSANEPQTVRMSRTAGYTDFGTTMPVLDDDAITFQIASREVNAIQHFVELNSLVVLTTNGPWIVKGGQNDVVTPTATSIKRQGYGGASSVMPVVIGSRALYVQDKGNQVRSLGYNFGNDAFDGTDLTVISNHLFGNRTIVDWCYQAVPFSCVWAVRDDGVLLGMTYMPEQEVLGWHRHDTDGFVESVACISEGNEDAVYCIVRREIEGQVKRYIERLATRRIDNVVDGVFLDSSLSYDGRQSGTITISGGVNWNEESATATSSIAVFVAGDVGNEVHLTDSAHNVYRLRITAFTSSTVVTAYLPSTLPDEFRGVASSWGLAKDVFSSLTHIEGKGVKALCDGHVVDGLTVTGGAVTVDYPSVVVHIGLPYDCDIQTLSVNVSGGNLLDKRKNIARLNVLCEESVGISAGADFDHLDPYRQRELENYDQSVQPTSGLAEIDIASTWSNDGSVSIRQSNPLPITILAIMPEVNVGG